MISELLGNDDIDVVSNPEFLREGSAVQDFLNPDRIVVGADSPIAGEKVGALYLGARCPVLVTDPVSAESIKYMANAFLAMKISFVNQAAEFCDAVGANVIEVMKGLGFDPRIGSTFLSPGPGWGGSCFPKDTRALVASARAVDRPMTMIEEAIRSNEIHIDRTAALILDAARQTGKSCPKIGVLGLTFKSNTDDTRESPALAVIRRLIDHSVELVAFDPLAATVSIDGMSRVMSIDDALREADVAAILTEWPEFSELKPHDFSGLMHGKTIVDARYLLDPESFANAGFRVISIGR
jgi:UDPglucose 6-dehydrogenase